ncbi:MAG TPA: c-type cytochrome [Gemmatimonadaceae bacterium]|jgi:cytochrome c oxidase cbb3-type subunit 3|nr:c-type cytochrome [Gemmatimonadaceae bacterium]
MNANRTMRMKLVGAASLLALASLVACKREERRFREAPPSATSSNNVTMSELQPGPSVVDVQLRDPYEDNAYAVSQGKQLFDQMNCSGCHSHGGGGIGPPLTDDEWIYGSDPQNIFSTIVQGRPNGMPSFRGKLANYQIWQLVSYVRALGGLQGKSVRTTRDDHMMYKESEQARDKGHPTPTFVPPTSIKQ